MYHRIDMGKLQKCFQWKVTAILVFQTRFITFKTYLRQEEGHHLLQKVYQKYENWYYCYNFYHTPNYWILTKSLQKWFSQILLRLRNSLTMTEWNIPFAQNIRHCFFSFINEIYFLWLISMICVNHDVISYCVFIQRAATMSTILKTNMAFFVYNILF